MRASELLQQLLQNRRSKAVGPDAGAPPLAGAPPPLVQQKSPSLLGSSIVGGLRGTQQWLASRGVPPAPPADDFGYEHVRRTAEAQQGRNVAPFAAEEPQFARPTAPRPSIDEVVAPPARREQKPFMDVPDKVRTRFGLLPGYRRGGEMQEGVPAVVGEEEPEVVIPRQPSVAIPVSQILEAVRSGQQAPVAEVAKAPEAAAAAPTTQPAPAGALPAARPPRIDPASGRPLAELGIPEDAEEVAKPSPARAILDEVESLRARREHAATREVADDDGRWKSAGKAALYGGVAALGATGDWRAALAGAATGAGVGAVRPQFDDEVERMHEVQGYDQKVERASGQAKETIETEGKLADIEDRREQRAEARRSRAVDLVLKLFNEAEEFDPAADSPLRRRAAGLGIELPAKRRREEGEIKYDSDGTMIFVPKGGQAHPVLGADGKPVVDQSKKMVTEDGLQVTQSEALSYRAHKAENEAERGERAEERRRRDEERSREDRIKALQAEVEREDALGGEADRAEAETRDRLQKLAAALAQRDTAAANLKRLQDLRAEDEDAVSAKDLTDAEAALTAARAASDTLHAQVKGLSERNRTQYGGLFEQDDNNWTARRVKGKVSENFIRLQGLRWGKTDAEIDATIEDARRRGKLR